MNMYRYWRNVVKFLFRDSFTFYSGGSPGAPAMTSQNVTTSNIPEYMKPYAKAMLGGAMEQAFNIDRKGNILGPKQYIPYGVDPNLFDATTTAQQQADAAQAALDKWGKGRQKADPKGYAAAQERANQANSALAAAQTAQGDAIRQAYMPIKQGDMYSETAPSAFQGNAAVAGFSPMQMQAFRAAQGLQLPGQFAEGSDYVRQAAQGSLGVAGLAQQIGGSAMGYGAKAADIGMKALEYGDIASRTGLEGYQRAVRDAAEAARISDVYGTQGAGYGTLGTQYGATGAGYGAAAAGQAGQGYGAQAAYQQQATSPGAIQAYMNPYLEASLAPQLKLLAQQSGIQSAAQQAAATSAGAFGGSRSALQNALNQQAGNMAAQQAIGQGYNQAFQQAQQAQQYGAGLGIQGLQAGTQAQLAGVQGAQAGMQGAGVGIQGAQTGLQGVGQRLGAGQLGLSGAGMGIQGQQAAIQGVQAALAGQGVGIQGAQAATGAGQLGLGAYGQLGSQGVNLANIGNQQLGAQQGIIGLQSQMGGMQQQQAQNIINSAMGQYDKSQQYPYEQFAFLSNMIRGLPMGGTGTSSQYQAAPNPWSQAAGLGIAGLGMYNAMGSDERLKENIVRVGELTNGIGLYEFEYKPEFKDEYGEGRYRGVMAQDVIKTMPEAIVTMPDGYMGVNYDMVGTWMEAL